VIGKVSLFNVFVSFLILRNIIQKMMSKMFTFLGLCFSVTSTQIDLDNKSTFNLIDYLTNTDFTFCNFVPCILLTLLKSRLIIFKSHQTLY
jgi:hypothetical protein